MISLKCSWELNEGLTWEDQGNLRYCDYKFADFKADTKTTLRTVEGRANFLFNSGNMLISAKVEDFLTNSYLSHNKVIWEAEGELYVSNMISDSDFIPRMRNYLPWYEKDDPVYIEILKAYDSELRIIDSYKKLIHRNLFIDTASENLEIWERDFGIKNAKALNLRQRREQVMARWVSQFGQLTRGKLKQIIETFSNAECDLVSDYDTCIVTIKFVGKVGLPDNIEGLKDVLNIVLPAHWDYKFEFTFSPWDGLDLKYWKDLEPYEWEKIKSWEVDLK